MANLSENSHISPVFYSALFWLPQYEVWNSVPEFDNYEVSNYGRIRNSTGEIKKPYFSQKGYCCFRFYNGKENKSLLIHRVVCILFHENELNKPCVNHKDGNKKNNHYKNLEWVTYSENSTHMYRVLKVKSPLSGTVYGKNVNSKSVIKIVSGVETIYDSLQRAADENNICASGICLAAKGKLKTYKGAKWRYS
jgi:hypothetical protein